MKKKISAINFPTVTPIPMITLTLIAGMTGSWDGKEGLTVAGLLVERGKKTVTCPQAPSTRTLQGMTVAGLLVERGKKTVTFPQAPCNEDVAR